MGRHRIHDAHKWEIFRRVLGNTSCNTPRPLDALFWISSIDDIKGCKTMSRKKRMYLVIVFLEQCTVFDLTKWRRVSNVAKFFHVPILQHHLLAIANYPSKRSFI
jgi:hypothetical protein